MTFPNQIVRSVRVTRTLPDVWAAITTAEGLGTWFGNSAEIDLRVGGTGTLRWDSGDVAQLTVERLEPETIFGYTWRIMGLPESDARRTYVEFTLAGDDAGTTITVVESGFAQLAPAEHSTAFEGNTGGWKHELDELVAYLGG